MSYRHLGLKTALSICIAFGAAACSDNSEPSAGDSNTLTQVQAQDLGQDAAEDVDEMIDASTFDGSTGLTLTSDVSAPLSAPPACVDVSPNPPVNSDNDIVPDSVRLDFSNCQFLRGNVRCQAYPHRPLPQAGEPRLSGAQLLGGSQWSAGMGCER